jgi:hypothetical protein
MGKYDFVLVQHCGCLLKKISNPERIHGLKAESSSLVSFQLKFKYSILRFLAWIKTAAALTSPIDMILSPKTSPDSAAGDPSYT